MASKPKLLEIQNLQIDIDVPAGTLHGVSGLDLYVENGETLCIVGESGCGKSITSLAILNLLPAKSRMTADKLEFEGIDLVGLDERQLARLRGDRIGMIFQEPMTSLNPVYTIGSQLKEVYVQHKKGSGREAQERAEYLLEKVGIQAPRERLKQYPHQLSGGLRQRIMIAMSLMCGPSLVIADEPTTALDVIMQAQTLKLLKSLQEEFRMGLILITHDVGVVASMADRVLVMYAGKAVETGTSLEIFDAPKHPYTQGLLGCVPVPGQQNKGTKLSSIRGMVPSMIGDLRGCMFEARCDYAHERCASSDIPLRELGPGRTFRCIRGEETVARNLGHAQISGVSK